MKTCVASKCSLNGAITIPPSKSQSIRALLFAALAQSESTLNGLLASPDINGMIHAIKQLGATIDGTHETLSVSPGIREGDRLIDAGNSGLILRFIGACATLFPGITALTGDESIRTRRPIRPLVEGLKAFGAHAYTATENCTPPLYVSGVLSGGTAVIEGADSQPVSALLIACAMSKGSYTLSVKTPSEKPWIDVTLSWLEKFKIKVENSAYEKYSLVGGHTIPGFTYTVPGDLSSLLFPVVGALLTQSHIRIKGVDMSDAQGDKCVLTFLESIGADIQYGDACIEVFPSTLTGGAFDLSEAIDALPVLAVLGTALDAPLTLYNGAIARKKESDRIAAMAKSLTKMGAVVQEMEDGLVVTPSRLTGTTLISYNDHRIAMSLLLAGCIATGTTTVTGCECIAKTYPTFCIDMQTLGAHIEER